ncbi:thiol-disulfide oxidoreductase DCC family protein [Planktotalea sp.]|uniref:thiol-disulfide oxidoreductase DCC family protein n=1 Tax=Planktotalea sp. TaxID=2029877 RepID=UPI003D6C000F
MKHVNLADYPLYSWRADVAVPKFADTGHLTVMDANCGICAKSARWLARADKGEQFRIIPLQSPLGKALLFHFEIDADDPTSWLYLENGRARTSMDGMISAGTQLGGLSNGLIVFRILPRFAQDWLYRVLARNRYKWFGHADLCALPDPEVQKRLLQ